METESAMERYGEEPQNQSTTIHKVSLYLHDADNPIYFPKLVSIGPYHYRRTTNLANMEDAKIIYFNDLKKRRSDLSSDTYVQSVQSRMIDAIEKYSSSVTISLEQFVKVMAVDSCFIVEFLIKWYLKRGESQLKQLMSKLLILKNDLLLAENQIPFFVLDKIYTCFMEIPDFKMHNSMYPSITLVEIALTFFMGDWNDALWAARKFHENNTKFDHLLHLYHSSLNLHLSKHKEKECSRQSCWSFQVAFSDKIHPAFASCHISDTGVIRKIHNLLKMPILSFASGIKMKWEEVMAKLNKDDRQEKWLRSGIPNATYLRDTGFSFKKKYTMEYEFMDITQKGTEISIPILHIDETTQVNFTNLIAFEQCLKSENNFTAYAMFMSHLIDAEEDVALPKECGIINNRLGTNQKVVDFFTSLCRGIYLDQETHYLSALFGFIRKYYAESYYKVKLYRVRKKYIPDYFTKPCPILCLLVSVMAVIITLLQVILAIIRFFHPR